VRGDERERDGRTDGADGGVAHNLLYFGPAWSRICVNQSRMARLAPAGGRRRPRADFPLVSHRLPPTRPRVAYRVDRVHVNVVATHSITITPLLEGQADEAEESIEMNSASLAS